MVNLGLRGGGCTVRESDYRDVQVPFGHFIVFGFWRPLNPNRANRDNADDPDAEGDDNADPDAEGDDIDIAKRRNFFTSTRHEMRMHAINSRIKVFGVVEDAQGEVVRKQDESKTEVFTASRPKRVPTRIMDLSITITFVNKDIDHPILDGPIADIMLK